MSENKALKEEDLEKVNGGLFVSDEYLPKPHGPHIVINELLFRLGQKFYVVNNENEACYGVGTLEGAKEIVTTSGVIRCIEFRFTEIHGQLRCFVPENLKYYTNSEPRTHWVDYKDVTLYLFD